MARQEPLALEEIWFVKGVDCGRWRRNDYHKIKRQAARRERDTAITHRKGVRSRVRSTLLENPTDANNSGTCPVCGRVKNGGCPDDDTHRRWFDRRIAVETQRMRYSGYTNLVTGETWAPACLPAPRHWVSVDGCLLAFGRLVRVAHGLAIVRTEPDGDRVLLPVETLASDCRVYLRNCLSDD